MFSGQQLRVAWTKVKWRTPGGRVGGGDSGDFVGALQCFDAALACGTAMEWSGFGIVSRCAVVFTALNIDQCLLVRSGQVHRSLVGHTGPVTALQFDDVHLVTGSLDRSIRVGFVAEPQHLSILTIRQIWDLRTGTIFDAFGYETLLPVCSLILDGLSQR